MHEAPVLFLALLVGASLGAIFFGGLWWTVRKVLSSRRPAMLFVGSLLLRTLIALAGFYLVSRGDWRRLMVCLLGFYLSRVLVTRVATAPAEKVSRIAGGGAT